jgi:hypothetical protein
MYLLAICSSSFEKFLLNSCAYLFTGCWFFGGWVFLVPCRFWILVPYRMSSEQRFSPFVWAVSLVWRPFPLLFRISLAWCNPSCLLFLLDHEHLSSVEEVVPYTYLFQCISYCFLELFQSFRPYINAFDPLWTDFNTGWETGI